MRQPMSARFFRLVALILALQFITIPLVYAKTLTADIVREKIQKRGRDSRVWLREKNGVYLHGRVNTIGHDSFQMQLWNDPNLVDVRYEDVIELHQGLGTNGTIVFVAVGIGASVGLAIFGIHEVHSNEDKTLTPPPYPAYR
jgi:hypothetical protein